MRLILTTYVSAALGIASLLATTSAFQLSTPSTFVRNIAGEAFIPRNFALEAKKGKKAGKQLVSDIDFDAFDDDEPMSKKDQLKAQKKAAKEAKKAQKVEAAAPAKNDPKAAALAALDGLDFDDDEPMSAKEKAKLEKQKAKEAKKAAAAAQQDDAPVPGMKDRKAAALKALEEMERMEAEMAASAQNEDVDEFGIPKAKMSKKEMKEAKKKAEKEAKKKAAKEAKKAAKRAAAAGEDADVAPVEEGAPDLVTANGDTPVEVSLSYSFHLFYFHKHI